MPDTEADSAGTWAGTQDIAANGSVEGYRADRTLPIRVELGRQLRRRRTWLIFGILALLPWLLLLAFELGDNPSTGSTGRSLADIATLSGLNFASFALYLSANLLLVMVTALFFGDTIASEVGWSSLKYLLAAPVPRGRLIRQKTIASAALTGFALILLTAMAMLVGSLWYGTGELMRMTGETLAFPVGLLGLVGVAGYMAIQLAWPAALALYLSIRTGASLAAVGGTMLVSILSQIVDQIPALGSIRAYLPTHYSLTWVDLLSGGLDWTAITYGIFSGLAYATGFVLLATTVFARKDITS